MNHQTKKIFEEVKATVMDEGIFSADQIAALVSMIELIEKAVAKEADCLAAHYH